MDRFTGKHGAEKRLAFVNEDWPFRFNSNFTTPSVGLTPVDDDEDEIRFGLTDLGWDVSDEEIERRKNEIREKNLHMAMTM